MDPIAEQTILAEIKHLQDLEIQYDQEANLFDTPITHREYLLTLAQDCIAKRMTLEALLATSVAKIMRTINETTFDIINTDNSIADSVPVYCWFGINLDYIKE